MQSNILHTVKKTIYQHHLPTPPCKTLVALSGGADSVCLLLILKELGYSVIALHCNFHLRGEESNRDEKFVRNFCQLQSVLLYVKDFDTLTYCKENGVSIEMGARDLRYRWFNEMLEETQSECICVAHHQQDQAETLLLNLLRGSGLRGLAAMRYRNGNIVRPMLGITRNQIEDYLISKKQTWVNDSTNRERDAIRNRIRLDIIPMLESINPKAVRHLAETASAVQETLPYLKSSMSWTESESTNNEVIFNYDEDLCFEASTLTELHETTRHALFTRTQLNDILNARTGALIESRTHRLLKHGRNFILRSKNHTAEPPKLKYIEVDASDLDGFEQGTAYFDSDKLERPLTIRPIQEADRMRPFGMRGTKLLSDIMTDLHLNRFEKEDQFVLIDSTGQILWLIGHRTSALNPVTKDTQKILKITY